MMTRWIDRAVRWWIDYRLRAMTRRTMAIPQHGYGQPVCGCASCRDQRDKEQAMVDYVGMYQRKMTLTALTTEAHDER